MNWVLTGEIAGGVVYAIGFFTSLVDTLENGPKLKEYRETYGHDLGLIVCGFGRGFKVVGWPVFGGIKFGIGAVTDTIKLIVTGRPKITK